MSDEAAKRPLFNRGFIGLSLAALPTHRNHVMELEPSSDSQPPDEAYRGNGGS